MFLDFQREIIPMTPSRNMEACDMLCALGALIVGVCCLCALIKRGAPKAEIVVRWPLVGMLPSLFMHIHDIYDWITEILIKSGGTFMFQGPSPAWSVLYTSDPHNVECILKTRFSSFPKGRIFTSAFRDLLGNGIFNADGESWIVQRRATVAEFNAASSLNYALKAVQDSVRESLMPVLEGACSSSRPLDLQEIFLRLTFDNVCNLAFGVNTGCLTPDMPAIPFAKAFEEATTATALRFVTPIFLRKITRRFGVGIDPRLHKALETIDGFAEDIISSRREEFKQRRGKSDRGRADLLSIFMDSRDEKGEPYSDKFLRDICINFILAGRDTSSVALSWFFWLLLQHPQVEQKIVEEIRGILKKRSESEWVGSESDWACFSREELRRMQYLHAALTETMRLYPPVPLDRKQVNEDVVLPNGVFLKKGTVVSYAIYSMGRMESVWGHNCREFKPERWLHNGEFFNQTPYKFTAFNGGPRMCLGKDFAYLQMKHVVASILHRFRLKTVNKSESEGVKYRLGLTLYMKKGVLVTLHPRHIEERNGGAATD